MFEAQPQRAAATRSDLATRTSRSDRGWSACRVAAASDISTLRNRGHFNLNATDVVAATFYFQVRHASIFNGFTQNPEHQGGPFCSGSRKIYGTEIFIGEDVCVKTFKRSSRNPEST